jgi:alpha-beta hydrolase superfamily lysophospholipase
VTNKTFNLITHDGINLFGQCWIPEDKTIGVINIIHSINDHSGNFIRFAQYFTEKNYVVIAFDLRGHGKSEGNKGTCKNCEDFYKDIATFLNFSKKTYKYPQYIYAHGFGANLILNYFTLHSNSYEGLIIASPLIGLSKSIFYHPLKRILKYFKFLTNTKIINILPRKYYTHDKTIIEEYNYDKLLYNKISLNLYNEILHSARRLYSTKHKINIPMLIMHGTRDVVSSYKGTISFSKHLNNVDIKIWDCFSHDLHNEIERIQIYDYIFNWINEKNNNQKK